MQPRKEAIVRQERRPGARRGSAADDQQAISKRHLSIKDLKERNLTRAIPIEIAHQQVKDVASPCANASIWDKIAIF